MKISRIEAGELTCIRYLNSLLFVLETVELALLNHKFGLELARVGADVTSEH